MKTLTSHEKKQLKKVAVYKDTLQLGKNGLSKETLNHIHKNLIKNEIVHIRVGKNTDEELSAITNTLETALDCMIVRVVGRVITIYRESEDLEPKDRVLG
jgi:RNA-binding protein YhbY